ncbi:uncharacterized protein TRAVEDRAFT_46948 [Trametes versicolor FP-101664 SS1]|uniref:uncharacterized protein n=1 Tax=Trametes versicolor (strain FP-101664) TaxID=717944 RepID=UPI00046233AF|nr:uncharacterized protein TRAVEDRAFT_46948 [Trametes versicolor FP-101664 SS1]EIW59646.1 hypothetical protein TRAVEDRAFT_46948 [Trametes versicolor FP-101664 SS1]
MSVYTIHVTGIAEATTEQHLTDFFTFCGKITSVQFDPSAHTATLNFEKPSAAKTALMLNGGTLDGAHLTITSDIEHQDKDDSAHADHIDQTDKPRAGIAAEYLAKGYTLSDQILQRAIELDQQRGISTRFLSYIQGLDTTIGAKTLGPEKTISGKVQETLASATQQAKAVDEQKGITKTAGDYYTRALSSPFGQKVKAFYTSTSKQVLDIHEEARRIAETQKAGAAAGSAPATASTGVGSAAPPIDPSVHSAATTADPTVAAGKTTEAPTVV